MRSPHLCWTVVRTYRGATRCASAFGVTRWWWQVGSPRRRTTRSRQPGAGSRLFADQLHAPQLRGDSGHAAPTVQRAIVQNPNHRGPTMIPTRLNVIFWNRPARLFVLAAVAIAALLSLGALRLA